MIPSRAPTWRISKCPTPGVIVVIIVLSMSRQSRTSAPPGEHSSKEASPGISTVQDPSASAMVPRGTVRRGLFEVWTGCPQRIGAPPNLTHSMISWLTTPRFLGSIVPKRRQKCRISIYVRDYGRTPPKTSMKPRSTRSKMTNSRP